ncbi:molybdopterin-dependent oxidoreductase [Notoacmeibacter ruber]|uniref:Molybdopterin oxidoreductase family protein n=1 Tax=Notoacmeibacter ruber TaxID=2670375 RepID=A0A3L7JCU6_9HYPH|nr:molybdopterin-dependent oxidoreductase [Notoacmeibacter ruber]RLQ88496.1 molybdopterin oxidoreductase family protein [Notoacmeibacter ruber]
MNETIRIGHTACPHDCPSTCALEVEILDSGRIGRVRGAKANSYTDGVICAKVARYAERVHHPDRLTKPLIRTGSKGGGAWKEAGWDETLDLIAERFRQAAERYGTETVWPYYYAGTMGLIQRDGIHRLRHAMRWSYQFDSICINPAWTGYHAGCGAVRGLDPREMHESDVIVIWGTNAVATQINVMRHATQTRKERGAKIVVIDVYDTETMRQADMGLMLKPGSDAALACAVMHVLFRDGLADRDYMARFTRGSEALETHLKSRGPQWAAPITGLSVEEIEAFAHLVGRTKNSFFRLGYGFTRGRGGAVSMHAALCIPAVTGAWQVKGGGALHGNGDIFGIDSSVVKGTRRADPSIRHLDQSRIGAILTNDPEALNGGPPVTAMLIQNTNPVNVAPEQEKVRRGFLRDDLFTVVHEQFMTETAELADVVLPATMFVEHDDIYRGGGHTHILPGPKLIDPPEGPKPNHHVIEELARRLGVSEMEGFGRTERQLLDNLTERSCLGTYDEVVEKRWVDKAIAFEEAHYLNGFAHPDGLFHFDPDWTDVHNGQRPAKTMGLQGQVERLGTLPDHTGHLLEEADAGHPFRLVTAPARNYLNSSFAETATSQKKEVRPTAILNEQDAAHLKIAEGDPIALSNGRGEVVLHAVIANKAMVGTVVAEGIWPNKAHENGCGINTLIGADPIAPHGGAAFHDCRVAIRKL